ncbi:acyl-phosphate glycerol 3-phosphate acyltransferase [Bradyrhizobium sp. i1.8.4]
MIFWIASVTGLAIAYLFGATPTGYLAGKLLKGIDIREHGSKSTGATNVLRTLGKWPALVVLLVDVLKGAGAIAFARWFYPWLYTLPSVMPPAALDLQTWVPWAVGLAGLAALLGHGRSIWLNFTGGQIRRDGARRAAGAVLARGFGCCDRFWRYAGNLPDCFPEFDARGVDGDRPDLRPRATVALPDTGDCRQHLCDCAPSRQHPAATGWDGAAPGARQPGIERRIQNLVRARPGSAGRPKHPAATRILDQPLQIRQRGAKLELCRSSDACHDAMVLHLG